MQQDWRKVEFALRIQLVDQMPLSWRWTSAWDWWTQSLIREINENV